MNISAEISLYPLSEQYSEHIDKFILLFKNEPAIKVHVNGMSTQLFGHLDIIWPLIQKGIAQTHAELQASFVIKVIEGIHISENVPEYLKD
jgi:uncharacterized protein YqgV (UPF0045/DUF77 family)